jgi:hypothetical protein
MTTHPTSANAGLIDHERTVRGGAHVLDLRLGPRKRATDRVAVDELAVLIAAERRRHELEKTDEASPISTIAC